VRQFYPFCAPQLTGTQRCAIAPNGGSRAFGLIAACCPARIDPARPAVKIGAWTIQGAAAMSELDVIVIHIRAEQAAEYERLFAERELPRWREYKERGAFLSARIFRAAFGTDRREDIAKYVIAVEVPSHAEHSEHDADPGFQEFNRLADAFQPEDPLVYGGQVLHAV
jgi:hypothetical protein